MVDFDKSDKMIKIRGKVEELTLTTDSTMIFRSLFKNSDEVLFLNKQRNIIDEPAVSVGLSTFPRIFIIYICNDL